MSEYTEERAVLRQLYAARLSGQLEQLCALFTADAFFRIAGSSAGKPIAITAHGAHEVRTWLTMMLKTFRLSDQQIVAMIVDGNRAAVHWRASIHSRITGVTVSTELVDVIELRAQSICSYTELFVPSEVAGPGGALSAQP
ncbi:MAG TPA: nuclear transport factor 2 family protein [Steroidobacteraceae bacterium]|nr:nuclear transport factor 2 family protein [Steroidobacteraceae bacterium]